MDINVPKGTKVKFRKHDDVMRKWGSNDETRGTLKVGRTYTVDHTEVHSWHTKVYLQEFPTKKFNSAHFV